MKECKMRIERIGGSRLDTDSEVWGLDQTTWELMWAGEAAMRKEHSRSKASWIREYFRLA